MPTPLRDRDPGRGLFGLLFYEAGWALARLLYGLFFRYKALGSANVPAKGSLLVVSNHLSNLDPFAIGLAIRCRHLVYIAKADLFKNPIASFLFRGVNCVPIKQGAPDTAAIRAAIDRLTGGSAVLIFPEGSRSPDGAMHPFKRGAWLVFARTECDVLPVAVEGTFDAFPRGRSRTLQQRFLRGISRLTRSIREPRLLIAGNFSASEQGIFPQEQGSIRRAGNSAERRRPGPLVGPGRRKFGLDQRLQRKPLRLAALQDRSLQIRGEEGQPDEVALVGIGRRG
ncbi:MAG: lysophospholipid acyltransferase family protein [bacterium]